MIEKAKDNNKKLQLFNAIKEVKREEYVGTLEALRYVRVLDDINNIPKIIANEINKNIVDSKIDMSFPATEENALGLVRGIQILNKDLLRMLKETHKNNEDIFIYLKIKEERLDKRIIYNDILDFELNNYYADKYEVFSGYEKLIKALSQLFKKTQRNVINAHDLGIKSATEVFERCYILTTDEKISVNKLIDKFDWTESMSKNMFYDVQNFMKKIARNVILTENNKKFNRALIDGIDKTVEIRRELLIDYIQGKELVDGLPMSVDVIKKWIDDDLEILGNENGSEEQKLKYLLKVLEIDNNFFERYISN